MKLLKNLGYLFTGLLTVLGITSVNQQPVHAETGNLTKHWSSVQGRMETRHPANGYNNWDNYHILRINGEAVFCLDPELAATVGSHTAENYVGQTTSTGRLASVDFNKMVRITRIAYYGYQAYPHDDRNYLYTQAMIWEVLGYIPQSFTGDLSMDEYRAWREGTNAQIAAHRNTVTFAGETHVLNPGESITLTDHNLVLPYINIPASEKGYTFRKDHNNLTITATDTIPDTATFTFKAPFRHGIDGTTVIWRRPGSQTTVSTRLGDPAEVTLTLEREPVRATPKLSSKATTSKGAKQGLASEGHKEVVTSSGLVKGEEYRLVSTQYNATTRAEIGTREVTFTANGTKAEHIFNYTVPAEFLGKIVYGAKLYQGAVMVADHTDMTNIDQTVTVIPETPEIVSEAKTVNGNKVGYYFEDHKEKLDLTKLTPNEEYTLTSYVKFKSTNIKWKEQTITFTPKGKTHTHTFTYTGISSEFAGDLVYGATLKIGNKVVAEHFELDNADQTVKVVQPSIVTIATTQAGRKVGHTNEQHVERATVTDVIAGRTYTLVARQYDKAGQLYATQRREIKPTATTHTETFTFEVPSGFTGHLVYAQELLEGNTQLANHYDLANTRQTVEVVKSAMTSVATSDTGSKQAYAHQAHKEQVDITGLINGVNYRLVSFAMSGNNQRQLGEQQTVNFTATGTTHTHTFTYNNLLPTYTGDVIYGARLYSGDTLLHEHYDIANKAQTVTVIRPSITSVATTEGGEKVGHYFEKHVETLTFTGLQPNVEHTVVSYATFESGERWKAVTRKFTPTSSTHTERFEYTGIGSAFEGNLIYGATLSLGNKVVAEHYSIDNAQQTIRVSSPKIVTDATTESGAKVGSTTGRHKEVATMTGLIKGRTYKLVAKQYDKTGKHYATQEREFVASGATHTEEFLFEVPNGFVGHLVYGQDLYQGTNLLANHYDLSNTRQTVEVILPKITTVATTVRGGKVGYQHEKHKEIANFSSLIIGRKYKVVAKQYDSTGREFATQEREFTAKATTHVEEFEFSVPDGFVGHIVYGEELYEVEGNVKIAIHYDLTNKEQTVEIVKPDVVTDATTQSGNKVGFRYEKHIEKAVMTNLIIGDKYKIVATQYDAEGKVLAEQEREFVAEAKEHTELFEFEVPVAFVGKIVYGEDLYHEDLKVATHFDLTNERQTIEVKEPEISTKATTVAGAKVGHQYENHKEIAVMSNLIEGRTYKVLAQQYDSTGRLHATQEREFVATSTTHTEEFIFSVPSGFTGNLVYVEELYELGNKLATHYDLTNKEQTVTVVAPEIETEATTQHGAKVGYVHEKHIEKAVMRNLIVGETYKVVAKQYDETGKLYAEQEREFTAASTEHTEVFEFTVPVSFVGKLVYGEDLFHKGTNVSTHYDLTNEKQTVEVKEPTVTTKATTEKGAKEGYIHEKHKEIATMTGLIIGREYVVIAKQLDATGKEYARQERKFTAKSTEHVEEFIFDVPKGFVGTIVYAEDLVSEGITVAVHYDLTNKEQTVKVYNPEVVTDATTKNNNKKGYEWEEHIEVARATGLIIGRKYKLVATQYDAVGNVLAKQEREFVAEKDTHVEEFTFKVPAKFVGKIVYGEDLYDGNDKVSVHYDLTNDRQTIEVLKPTIVTTAHVNKDKKDFVAGSKVVISDTLTYSNFKDEEVLIKTWVVKYGTDEKVSEVFERVVRLNGKGEYVVELVGFDTSKLPAGKYVLMEEVYEVKDGKSTGELIAKHTDNKDERQSFTVKAMPVTGSNDLDGREFLTILSALTLGTVLVARKKRNEQ